jgi:acetate kinase
MDAELVPSSKNPILIFNSGSSSLKFGLFTPDVKDVRQSFGGAVQGIGTREGRIILRDARGTSVVERTQDFPNQNEAIRAVADALAEHSVSFPSGIGHRVVHGGPSLLEHQRITPAVIQQLEAALHFAPLHVPVALTLIRAAEKHFPGVPQFACFDTAFHKTLPEAAARLPLPQRYCEAGVRRYGFHGLSCESVLHSLGRDVRPRMIVAHLGNGASVTAAVDGNSIDTSMGLTPAGGILMGTRPGDLDPGVLIYLLRSGAHGAEELEALINKECGLRGVSGISSDMRELHQAMEKAGARLAIRMFCLSARKAIAGMIAVMAGVDAIVFTGGIGEHDPVIREGICEGLTPFGVHIDAQANARNARNITRGRSGTRVYVIPAEEEAQIARHVARLLNATPALAREARKT